METQQQQQQPQAVDQRGRASSENESSQHNQHHQHHRRPMNRRVPSATSKTPRRRNNTNPQSSSPPRNRDDDIDDNNVKKQDGTTNHMITDNNNDNSSQTPTPPPPTPTLLTTPLCTLTHLLHQSHTNHQLTRQLFRTSHSLHLHASTQKAKAVEAYKLAQAELEHATTAEEFALQELQRARVKKEEASNVYGNLKRQVGKLAGGYKGARVTLVNLQTNSNWNGRVGTIVKLITEGVEEEDVGRWKVRLDGDWRGKEPDGNYEYGKRYLMLL